MLHNFFKKATAPTIRSTSKENEFSGNLPSDAEEVSSDQENFDEILSDEQDRPSSTNSRRKRRKASHDQPIGGLSKWAPIYSEKYPHIEKSTKGQNYFYCRACDTHNKMAKLGERAIADHVKTKKHDEASRAVNKNAPMTAYIKYRTANEEKKSIAAECTFAYHCAKHNFSLRSMMCASKLIPNIFEGSPTAERFASSKTKTKALIKGALHPHFDQKLINEIEQNGGYYSIGVDSTPHLNHRIHGIVIRYFDGKIKSKNLKLSSMTAENAASISEMIQNVLLEFKLDPLKMVSLCADNTTSNFGGVARRGQNNVFAILQKEFGRSFYGIGCSSHILHNSANSATTKMYKNVEAFANSIVSHFSNSLVRFELFANYCKELGIVPTRFPNHHHIRWLTLGRLCSAIVKVWSAIEMYFRSQEEVPIKLKKIFSDDNFTKSKEYQALFIFISFILEQFNAVNLKTQDKSLSIAELVAIIKRFHGRLQSYLDEQQFGAETNAFLRTMETDGLRTIVVQLQNCFKKFYFDALDYLNKWFVFLDEFGHLEWLIFKDEISFKKVEGHYRKFCSDIPEELDQLFDEVLEVKESIKKLECTSFSHKSVEQRWCELFKNNNLQKLKIIVSIFLSIFPSNSFCESVFSILNGIWTDEKNQFSPDTINSIVSVKINSDLDCYDAFDYFLSQNELLDRAKGFEKYERE